MMPAMDNVGVLDERSPLLGSEGGVTENDNLNPDHSLIGLSGEEATYRSYRRRWYILATVAVLNISNGMLWITFSPIADSVAKFYHITSAQVNWLSAVFMVASIPIGILSTWFLDTLGLRAGIILSSWLNVAGSVLRVVSCLDIGTGYKYPTVLGGQILCAVAQPLAMFAPTKVAALWFREDERALGNMIGSLAGPIGIMFGSLLSPVIVKHYTDLLLLMQLYTVPAGIVVLMATFGVCSSLPPTAPSSSADEEPQSFTTGMKKMAKNKAYWVLAICFGAGVAILTVFTTLVEQILCPRGYSDTFAGLCSALMLGVGLVGAGIAAVYVDRTKKFEEVAKVGLALSAICFMAFFVVARYSDMEVWLAVLISLCGFFGCAISPICLELSIECTFPVPEATSAGFLYISGQIQAVVYILGMQALTRPLPSGKTSQHFLDYTVPNMALSVIAALAAVIFIIFFKCQYKRLQTEQQIIAQKILNQGTRHQALSLPVS